MKKFVSYATPVVAIAAAMAFAGPANAARTLCTSGPGIDLTAQACVYNPEVAGNDNDTIENVTAAIFEATGENVLLSLYGKSDDNTAWFNFTPGGDPEEEMTVDWSVIDGTLIKYVTVKAANEFKVFELAGLGASSGTASTLDMLNSKGKNRPGISHISFWTAAAPMPEPGTWAMLILGFGAVGGAMRSASKRRTTLAFG